MKDPKLPQPEDDHDDDDYNEEEFIRCDRCDGHDACEDFGCAYDLGLGHMVERSRYEQGDFDW